MKNFTLSIQGVTNDTKCRSYNGYASWLSLVCFAFLIQIMSLVSVYTLNSAYLIKASRQSTFDLSCISQARHIIENNNIVSKCNYSLDKLISNTEIEIMDKTVSFIDKDTFINCVSDNYVLNVYYDEKGISGIEFE